MVWKGGERGFTTLEAARKAQAAYSICVDE